MQFTETNEKLNQMEEMFATPPVINVINKDRLEERISMVFNEIYESLARSFGPGGSASFVSSYPAYFSTKDGYTIMKNITFDKKLDQVICDMIAGICDRLNFTVGDGTTTATIATKSIYDAYTSSCGIHTKRHVLPREVLNTFEEIKNDILDRLTEVSKPIQSDNSEELKENIRKVVWISSNGNKEITDIISNLYGELMFPAISVSTGNSDKMVASIIDGYNLDVSLTDKLYVNNDDGTMKLRDVDVIMFDHKVTNDTYTYILKPLAEQCRVRGRHLICMAPRYDEKALDGQISFDLKNEYKQRKDITLVLTAVTNINAHAKTLLSDLAMLMNTSLISTELERNIIESVRNNPVNLVNSINIDNRKINGINVARVAEYNQNGEPKSLVMVTYENKPEINDNLLAKADENSLRLGFCNDAELGMDKSTFKGFYYDQHEYDVHLADAKEEYEKVHKKSISMGVFSLDAIQKQQRVYALGMKTGIIEVGSSSEITQGYLKDTVDDAVKAAASAYNNGVILGCNVSLLQVLNQYKESTDDELKKILVDLLINGFRAVYETVIINALPDIDDISSLLSKDEIVEKMKVNYNFNNFDIEEEYLHKPSKEEEDIYELTGLFKTYRLVDSIIDNSIGTNQVFDLSKGVFCKDIINSAETDKEILKATIDLLSLLIVGNQMVIR